MEESSVAPEILQISSYVNDHTGFCGIIKAFPSDFIVTEINILGQLVNETAADSFQKTNGFLLEQRTSGQEDAKKLRIDKECCRSQVDHIQSTTDRLSPCIQESEASGGNPTFECHLDKVVTLDSLLDEPIRDQLHQFACHVKHTWNSPLGSGAVLPEFPLGSIPDKKIRASLHGAIRQEYPFLITVTKCGEIIVKANQDYQELCQLVSEEEASGFLKFLDAKLENSKFAFRPDGNKENRKRVHHFLGKKFGKLIETKSFPDSQEKFVIMVRFREKSGFGKRANSDTGEKHNIYTAFTLRKENLETLEAINYLSAKLGILPSDFSYTGIKDKRAITYQAMVVKKVTPQRLKELGNAMGKKGLGVSHIHSVSQPLRLGQLQGNRFDIIVRDLKLHNNEPTSNLKEQTCEAIENVKKNGFINYYGSQRFGQGQNIQTDQIGLALLNEQMRIQKVPLHCCLTLNKVWNEAASYRVRIYGTRVVTGDLIFSGKSTENCSLGDRVHVVTTAEETDNKYTIDQVILPMVGHSIQYPANEVGKWYHRRLAEDGLQMCQFRLPALQLNVPGCYRHLLKYPHALSYRFLDGAEKEMGMEGGPLLDSKLSLSISFHLDSSCYATACLGEIMKCKL